MQKKRHLLIQPNKNGEISSGSKTVNLARHTYNRSFKRTKANHVHRWKRKRSGVWTCAISYFFFGCAQWSRYIYLRHLFWPSVEIEKRQNPRVFPKKPWSGSLKKKTGVLRSIRWRNPHLQPGIVPSITLNVHWEEKLAQVYLMDSTVDGFDCFGLDESPKNAPFSLSLVSLVFARVRTTSNVQWTCGQKNFQDSKFMILWTILFSSVSGRDPVMFCSSVSVWSPTVLAPSMAYWQIAWSSTVPSISFMPYTCASYCGHRWSSTRKLGPFRPLMSSIRAIY